jgi:DNA adenine methylase
VLEHICARLPEGRRLIEPFVGSGVVFLNTNYSAYLLNDVNADLINIYKLLQTEGQTFIKYAKSYFTAANNQSEKYYQLREEFNNIQEPWQKAGLFLYLNRHGYNGLCRYNKKGGFNVPFGRYNQPYFPEAEMQFFHQKAQRNVTFTCGDFHSSLNRVRAGHVVYCDPPYVPLTTTANFTQYARQSFLITDQQQLAQIAEQLAKRGIPVLISNHDLPFTRATYQKAQLDYFPVARLISCKGNRRFPVKELLALFS